MGSDPSQDALYRYRTGLAAALGIPWEDNDSLLQKVIDQAFSITVQTNQTPPSSSLEIPIALHVVGPSDSFHHWDDYLMAMNKMLAPIRVRLHPVYRGEIPPDYAESLNMVYDIRAYDPYLVEGALNIVVGGPLAFGGTAWETPFLGFMASPDADVTTWLHELGHVFGLFHTFHRVQARNYDEWVQLAESDQDCTRTDDRICDTAPDVPISLSSALFRTDLMDCRFDERSGDGFPDFRNIMSYYPVRDHLTPGQLNVMRWFAEHLLGLTHRKLS